MNEICQNCDHGNLSTLYHAPAFDVALDAGGQYFDIGRCHHCNIVSTIGVDEGEIATAYSAEYYGSPSQKFTFGIEQILGALARRRALTIFKQWREPGTDTTTPAVLDIGCGRGILLRAFRELGADVTGLERPGFSVDDAVRDIVRIGELSDPEMVNQRFDIVILWHALEHIRHPDGLLEEITRHINKNGLLIIAVPNFDSWQRRLFGSLWFHLDLPRHVIHFEPIWLIDRLEGLGYSTEHVTFLEPVQDVYGFLQSTLNHVAPSRLNELYGLLKRGDQGSRKPWRLAMWLSFSVILLPFACFESVLGALSQKGATFAVTARLEK